MIETFDGDDWSVVEKRRMSKSRTIDRRNYCYEESVVDPKTGEVIHECCEPLDQHRGHGSARSDSGDP